AASYDQYLIQTASGSLAYNAYSHRFTFEAYDGRNGGNGTHARYWWSFANNIEGAWTHLAFTVADDNTARFYINGLEVPIPAGVHDLGEVGRYNVFNIGALQDTNNISNRYDFFSGLLDEVRIYSGTLSASEVLNLATGGAHLTIRTY